MAPRSSWKGFIKLSLVSVPVKGYTASNTSSSISLNQLHKSCHNRIRYQKTCPEHGEVSNDEIVKGYEYAKGEYVVIDEEELEKLRTESDRSIQIDGFIDPEVIDPLYHAGKTYYLVPDGAVGQKPYNLLLQGMKDNNVCAIAQVVLSGREQAVLLRPLERLLALTVLSHENEIKNPQSFWDEVGQAELSKEEVSLTNTLIEASRKKKFDFGAYRDTYMEKLTQLIQMKVEGREVVQVPSPEEPKIINLMEALKRSVAAAQAGSPGTEEGQDGRGKAGGKMAPSTRSRSRKKTGKEKVG